MNLHRHLRLALLGLALVPAVPALAADYDPPIYTDKSDQYVPVEVGSGWYLRGDVGYAVSTSTNAATYRTFDPATLTYGGSSFDTSKLSSQLTWGGGVGYRFTDWVRSDVTVDGFRSKFSGTTSSAAPCGGAPLTTTCRTDDGANVSAISFMANGYVDLGTYVGITPYVGAGAGVSYLSWSDMHDQAYCVGADCTSPLAGSAIYSGTKDWRFTWAVMAGASYDINKSLKLDVGYKYRKIQGGDMFNWDTASAAAGATGIQGKDGGFGQHEVRVGLRYELW